MFLSPDSTESSSDIAEKPPRIKQEVSPFVM
jgi:hypothetical protein